MVPWFSHQFVEKFEFSHYDELAFLRNFQEFCRRTDVLRFLDTFNKLFHSVLNTMESMVSSFSHEFLETSQFSHYDELAFLCNFQEFCRRTDVLRFQATFSKLFHSVLNTTE